MKAKYARLIRIGIMSRCIPYIELASGALVFDFSSYRGYQYDWFSHAHISLVKEAHDRTQKWTVSRRDNRSFGTL